MQMVNLRCIIQAWSSARIPEFCINGIKASAFLMARGEEFGSHTTRFHFKALYVLPKFCFYLLFFQRRKISFTKSISILFFFFITRQVIICPLFLLWVWIPESFRIMFHFQIWLSKLAQIYFVILFFSLSMALNGLLLFKWSQTGAWAEHLDSGCLLGKSFQVGGVGEQTREEGDENSRGICNLIPEGCGAQFIHILMSI